METPRFVTSPGAGLLGQTLADAIGNLAQLSIPQAVGVMDDVARQVRHPVEAALVLRELADRLDPARVVRSVQVVELRPGIVRQGFGEHGPYPGLPL